MARAFRNPLLIASTVTMLMAAGAPESPATARVIAGECELELEAERTATSIDISTPTAGSCTTTDGSAEGSITATDLTVTVGTTCAVGVAQGMGSFELEFPPTPDVEVWRGVSVTVAYEGPVIEMTLVLDEFPDAVLVGEGEFVQMPVSHPNCDTATGHTFTWKGKVVFEDPVLEVPA